MNPGSHTKSSILVLNEVVQTLGFLTFLGFWPSFTNDIPEEMFGEGTYEDRNLIRDETKTDKTVCR